MSDKSTTISLPKLLKKEASKIVFLPIKPVYAERIMNGTKAFEFRRSAISSDITHIIVYASSPTKKVLGIIGVNSVQVNTPRKTWEKTKSQAGISRQDYMEYFHGREKAYCIEIDQDSVVKFQREVSPFEVDEGFRIPQSFTYVDTEFLVDITRRGFARL